MSDKIRAVEKAVSILLDSLSPASRELVRQHLVAQGTTLPKPGKPGRRPRVAVE